MSETPPSSPAAPSRRDVPLPVAPGLRVDGSGRGTFGVHAPRAQAVDLCVRRGSSEQRIRLTRYDGGMWWDEVEGMTPGTRYGLRVHGPWDPQRARFHNPARLLLDPRGTGISHASPLLSSMFAHEVDALLRPADGMQRPAEDDNADDAVWSVVVPPLGETLREEPLRTPWTATVVYEAHVRGLTMLHPDLPPELRGTYAGLGHRVMTDYLRDLGVTAIELLPIHAIMDEPHLTRLALTNYWGYSTLSYFAPHPGYATRRAQEAGAAAVRDEVRSMVRSLHAAGIEVICDVVYNHTAEGGADGPSLSLRGLDAQDHYWTDHGAFVDFTGTGNSLNMRSGHVVDLIVSSLRHWVREYGIDGFRFDLAATLGRDDRGFRSDHPLLRAITTDEVLRGVKLIAEPWDVGGYGWQTGSFPPPFAEWNDAFRNDVRSFWLEDPARRVRTGTTQIGGVRDIATRLAGSADVFTRHDPQGLPPGQHLRAPWASLNYVTAHDGFTLADLTAYERKRNEANGEDGRDGTDDNRSWNHGIEGPLGPAEIAASEQAAEVARHRRRTARSLMATLLLSAGTPMITAGDEALRTQQGNNNAYCQDNRISWVDWDRDEHQRAMHAATRDLLALRRRFSRLRPATFLGDADPERPEADQIAWFGADGEPMRHGDWLDPDRHTLQMLRPGPAAVGHVVLVVNGSVGTELVRGPAAPWSGRGAELLFASCEEELELGEDPDEPGRPLLDLPGGTLAVLLVHGTAGVEDRLG
ncbi:glycogen debranching protein GlgX [Brachybacterium nesterenkovii]|uniref:glycogen debranching protein GlgX n=1 Tax=Brachybacterium nesterenkovii TaxID=47847 RepID=UPI003219A071